MILFINKVNLKNPYINNLIPEHLKSADVSVINKFIWEKDNIEILKQLTKAEEGRLAYFKDSPLTSVNELMKYSDIIYDKLSDWDKEFILSTKEQDLLSVKQKALCLRLINSVNYAMWKAGLNKQWLIEKYNETNEVILQSETKVINLDTVDETKLTDENSLIEEFKIVKENFDDVMETKLYEHQVLRVNFFLTREGNSCIEASVVGSGKTLTGLAYAEHLYNEGLIKHIYVICPLVMVETWKKEIIKHTKAKDLSKYTILNYEKITKFSYENSKDSLLILDEGHKLKNINGLRFKHLSKFNFKYCLPMSATIIGNTYDELRAIYKLLGKRLPLKNGMLNLPMLKKDLIRISQDMLNLPELVVKNIPLELDYPKEYSVLEANVFEEIKKDKELAIKDGKRPPNELVKVLRLNQYSSNRNIIMENHKPFIESNKFKAVLEILADNQNEQFVLWSNFVPTIKELESELSEYYDCKCIYGEIKQAEREGILEDFRNNKFKILIINPSTLNAGVTLVNATRMIYFDRDFSSIKFIQSRGRFHRINQTNKCIMYNLYYADTIEEKVIEVLERKEEMINSILENGQVVDDITIKELLDKH